MKRWGLGAALLLAVGPTRGAGEQRFDPGKAATPYFVAGAAKDAVAALARDDFRACATSFQRVAQQDGKLRAQAEFDGAYCAWKAGDERAAAKRFDALVESYPVLADEARLYAAEALLAAGDLAKVAPRARAVSSASPLKAEADLAIGTALERGGQATQAADAYAKYLRDYPGSWRVPEIRARLATSLDAAGRADEATTVWREVALESPVSHGAQARLDPARPLTAAEQARRATSLFDAMRNKESELAWVTVLSAPELTPQLACRARYNIAQSVWKQRDRARAAPLFEESAKACEDAHDVDLFAKSLYQAGRSHGSRAEKDPVAGEKALALYLRLMIEQPTHSYADDAALRRADVLDTLGKTADATAALVELPGRFPTGDQRGEALFRLAFRAFELRDLPTATKWLQRELELLPREEGWYEAGRTLYWLARCQTTPEAAQALYVRALREYPLSYYALLAANRLLHEAPEVLATQLDALSFKKTAPTALTVEDRPLFHSEAFARAVELLRLGLGHEARRELTAAGLETAKRGTALPADPELGWVTAALHEAAGDYAASHAFGRYVDLAFMRSWPQGPDELRWRLTFPRAYGDLVEQSVAKTGQPAALELAIMREESAFDPNLESFANAVGLTQLTQPPATRFAEGLPHDPQALRDPVINITIGARELGAVYTLFDRNAPLAIAGYNAGEGAVKRWLRHPENKDRALDEFVERIPYDETRGYTKRVLGTYFTYAWLDRATWPAVMRVPKLELELPHGKKK